MKFSSPPLNKTEFPRTLYMFKKKKKKVLLDYLYNAEGIADMGHGDLCFSYIKMKDRKK